LVRAGIPADEWTSFRGDGIKTGEFRVAMLLLAATAGSPATARKWFEALRNADSTALLLPPDDSKKPAPVGWMRFKKVHGETFTQTASDPPWNLITKWLDRVERFSF
jgi:hypothetical protein